MGGGEEVGEGGTGYEPDGGDLITFANKCDPSSSGDIQHPLLSSRWIQDSSSDQLQSFLDILYIDGVF